MIVSFPLSFAAQSAAAGKTHAGGSPSCRRETAGGREQQKAKIPAEEKTGEE